jgi:hypothetical protein
LEYHNIDGYALIANHHHSCGGWQSAGIHGRMDAEDMGGRRVFSQAHKGTSSCP